MAFPPEPIGAYVGQPLEPEVMKKIATEGARTIPGREHGGNCDVRHILLKIDGFLNSLPLQIKNLSRFFFSLFCRTSTLNEIHRGSKCYFPVFVKGANLSVGDLHFSQGDVRSFPLILTCRYNLSLYFSVGRGDK